MTYVYDRDDPRCPGVVNDNGRERRCMLREGHPWLHLDPWFMCWRDETTWFEATEVTQAQEVGSPGSDLERSSSS